MEVQEKIQEEFDYGPSWYAWMAMCDLNSAIDMIAALPNPEAAKEAKEALQQLTPSFDRLKALST